MIHKEKFQKKKKKKKKTKKKKSKKKKKKYKHHKLKRSWWLMVLNIYKSREKLLFFNEGELLFLMKITYRYKIINWQLDQLKIKEIFDKINFLKLVST